MARLLYALHLLLEDGMLAHALEHRAEQGDCLQHLATLLHSALHDMASTFPQHAPMPSGNLNSFLKVCIDALHRS